MAKNSLGHTPEYDTRETAKSKTGKAIFEGALRAKREAVKAGARPPEMHIETSDEGHKQYTPGHYLRKPDDNQLQKEYKEFRAAKKNAAKKAKRKK